MFLQIFFKYYHWLQNFCFVLLGPPGPSAYRPPGPGGYPPPGPQGYLGYPGQQGPPMGQVVF
jgi:hypothetical protein